MIFIFKNQRQMKKVYLLCIIISSTIAFSQKPDLTLFKNLKTRSIGPAGMSGRVTSIDAVISNPDIIYLGTASGGVWKTDNGGTTWQPIFDEQPILNIGAVTIQQSNPSVLWAGTGEGNPRNSLNIGGGIYKSLDAGKTWKMTGLEKTKNIHRILIDPTNPDVVYAAAIGNPYSEHPERGVFKTTDGGQNWNRILYTNDTSGCADLVMDPSNPNKLIAAMWQHRRTPWSFNSGGIGSGLYVTWDGGKSWKKSGKEEGMPEGDLGRIGLAIAPSEPNRIYAMIEATKNGLYKSDDGGSKWELVNSDTQFVTVRSFYFNDIRVDPKNENRLYSLYQPIAVSEDGGKSFRVNAPNNKIHADHHAMWINPLDPAFIIEGGDGGISISRDRGKTWRFEEQLPLGQFYHINVDNELPYHVMGGLQDNGSWRGPGYIWIDEGIRNSYWDDLNGGDGFDVAPDPEDANWIYSMSQGGALSKTNVATGERASIRPPTPDLQTRLRFNWNAALAIDPLEPSTVYYGSQFLHKSANKGMTWEIISPDLTTNNKEQQKQDENGGLSIDITGAENYNTIICIAPSSKQKGVIWIGTDDGNVQLTKDGGRSWTNFRGKITGMPVGCWIPQIKASQYNAGEAFVVCNDYRRGDFKPYIFRTKDFGNSWQRMLNETKVKGYALCIIQDPAEPNLIFAGTEQGLWLSFDDGNNFQQWKNDYPSVSTYDLAIQEREADLVIATFGRAIYILDDIWPLRKIAQSGQLPFKKITAYNTPVSYMARYRKTPGFNSNSWGLYEAKNRNRGAEISFFMKPALKSASKPDKVFKDSRNKKVKDTTLNDTANIMTAGEDLAKIKGDSSKIKTSNIADSVVVTIYNSNNELIRTLKIKTDTGFNRYYWGFEMKGIRLPGSPKPKENSPEPVGLPVFPGTYKLVFTSGKDADSTLLVVKEDPNVPVSKEMYDAKMAFNKRLEKSMIKLTAVTDQLTDAEETIKKVEGELKDVEGKQADSMRKSGKAMTDSIKNIRDLILGKKQEKQGYGTPYQLTSYGKLNEVRLAVLGKNKIPDAQEEMLASQAELLVQQTIDNTNNFFATKWKEYQLQVESTPLKLFKEFKPVE
jgi:photosystem II stability/assembly factor-like uncharacterized protein